MMDGAVDVANRMVEALFGPEGDIPWWAWLGPIILLLAKLMYPVVFPETAAAEAESDRRLAEFCRERDGKGKAKKSKKGKKGKR
ncbi:hypothetical protein Are01nite_12450 [Actinoplanes regularis]|nr:hypothetical protein Are01nite_12450 [Actinoplanes regularis]